MRKGLSLVETILYISLLSMILINIFYSLLFYIQSKISSREFSDENYNKLIENFHEK